MKYKIHMLLFSLLTTLLWTGCQEYEEMNLNPNEPTEVSPDVLLASSIRQSVNAMVTESFLLGNNAGQLTAKTLRTEVDAYNWNAFPTVWEGLYESLTDLESMERIAVEQGNEPMQGVAIAMRSWIFSTLTNAYGSIPYFEAIQGAEDVFTPGYTPQPDIYADLLSELDRAVQLLEGDGQITGDLIYNGDADKWIKLANSLHLRLIMTGSGALQNPGQLFADVYNTGNIMSSNDDNAVLEYLQGFPNEFPLVPLKTGDFDAVALSENAYTVMNGYNDPRLLRYARPNNDDYTNPTFSGAVNGSNSANCPKTGSRLGVQYYNYPEFVQYEELGLSQADGIIMTYAEVEFLIAEAIAKGWISGDIETHYRDGIAASMEYYEVDLAPFNWSSFADFYDNSGVQYNEVMDIWEQKWLALFFTGLEPYFEVRRWYLESGEDWGAIPFLSAPCENLNNDQLPMRFLYPGEEQSLNSANYQSAVEALGGSNSQNARMWLVQ